MEYCPINIPDPFNQELSDNKAIHIYFSQAVPRIPVIDTENCVYFQRGKCKACQMFCPTEPNSIDFEQQDTLLDLDVGTIILATGFKDFDPALSPRYGYGMHDDVLTGLEFERLVNSGGPTTSRLTS